MGVVPVYVIIEQPRPLELARARDFFRFFFFIFTFVKPNNPLCLKVLMFLRKLETSSMN